MSARTLIQGDTDSEDLREAVESGRAALAGLDDARAAIIACHLAMERSLAERGTARGAADTPDELLARAVAAGLGHGAAARRLTALFYEARFSSHATGVAGGCGDSAVRSGNGDEKGRGPQSTGENCRSVQ